MIALFAEELIEATKGKSKGFGQTNNSVCMISYVEFIHKSRLPH